MYLCRLPNIMKKTELENKIFEATFKLIDMATEICWNKISRSCEYIISEIDENTAKNYFERAKIRKKVNAKKSPKPLKGIAVELTSIYENLYDLNLHIYKSLPNKTLIEIRYFLKTSHIAEFYPIIITNAPMLHCKVARPSYAAKSPNSDKLNKKFDVNWELGGIRHELNKFLGKLTYQIWKWKHVCKQKL